MSLSLTGKLNSVLLLTFAVCFALTGVVAKRLLNGAVRDQVLHNARLLMDSSTAAAGYTAQQIVPLLQDQLKVKFLPQSLPDYAATENLNALRDSNPGYSFKEAMLNPTNPRDRATDWEQEIIVQLRDRPNAQSELVGERTTATGSTLYVARPIIVKNQTCLECHGLASAAPRNVLDVYGNSNGFNWTINEVIGAKIVSVPMSMPESRARTILWNFMLWILLVFVVVFIALDVMVRVLITRRISSLSRVADAVSMGKLEDEAFDTRGDDELSGLARSLERLRSSLAKAMKMLQ